MAQQEIRNHLQNPSHGGLVATTARLLAAVILLAIGLLALLFPALTGVSAASVAPVFLILGGAVGLFDGLLGLFHDRSAVVWSQALFGLIYLGVGVLLAANLGAAVMTMGVIVAAGFLSQALVAAIALLSGTGHRLWLLLLACCNALLAWMSFVQWPFGAMDLLGLNIGISVISWGIAMLFGGFTKGAA